jgi:hypothetical protein
MNSWAKAVNAHHRWSIARRARVGRPAPQMSLADNFVNVYYDAAADNLVVTMSYRGTNPDHTFTLRWDGESKLPAGNGDVEKCAEV